MSPWFSQSNSCKAYHIDIARNASLVHKPEHYKMRTLARICCQQSGMDGQCETTRPEVARVPGTDNSSSVACILASNRSSATGADIAVGLCLAASRSIELTRLRRRINAVAGFSLDLVTMC